LPPAQTARRIALPIGLLVSKGNKSRPGGETTVALMQAGDFRDGDKPFRFYVA
jgi:hypothetical protein